MTKDNWAPVWPFVLGALGLAGVGGLMRTRPLRPILGDDVRMLGGCFLAFGALSALLAVALSVSAYFVLASHLRSGRVQVVEGMINNFDPGKVTCHSPESFDVSQVHFEYADNVITGGFNHTSTCGGGPFRSGQRVRLDYVVRSGENVIVRAAIRK